MQASKSGVLAICFLVVAGCASAPEKPVEQSSKSQESARLSASEELVRGKSVAVETSQGTVNVAPTVVAIGDGSQQKDEASIAPYYYDPWEGFNRAMFSFNNVSYQYVLIPLSDGYKFILPGTVRDKIGNAFDNLREPLNLLNNTFSGEFNAAGANLGRFLINSTVGLLGLFDPADDWFDIKPQKQTLANTLQHYNVGSGAYLVIPILGPSDTRGAFSTLTEGFIHPVNYVADSPQNIQIRMVDGLDDFSEQSDIYQQLFKQAEDPYIYFRNQYIQGQRRDELFELSDSDQQNNE